MQMRKGHRFAAACRKHQYCGFGRRLKLCKKKRGPLVKTCLAVSKCHWSIIILMPKCADLRFCAFEQMPCIFTRW